MANADDRYYSTCQFASLLKLDRRTIINLFDAGYLKGYRMPNCRHRRITRKSAHEFMLGLGHQPPEDTETPREP